MIRNLVYGLQNIWAWLPVIWKDRDWDYLYLLKLLRFKLGRMQAHFNKHALLTDDDLQRLNIELGRARYLLRSLLDGAFEERSYGDWQSAWPAYRLYPEPLDGLDGFLTRYKVLESDTPSADALMRAGGAVVVVEHAALVELCQTLMLMEGWWD
jgi:hypothetical protein